MEIGPKLGRRYSAGTDGPQFIMPVIAVKCDYCGTKTVTCKGKCYNCGAPRSDESNRRIK